MSSKALWEKEIVTGIVKTLLANTPTTMDLAVKYGLTPAEVGSLLYEALLHHEGGLSRADECLPIIATPPSEIMCLSPSELRGMLGECQGFAAMKLS